MVKTLSPEAVAEQIAHYRSLFGCNLRLHRLALGLLQRDVAEAVSLKQPYISDIENGLHNVSLDLMVKLALVVRVPLSEMFIDRNSLHF